MRTVVGLFRNHAEAQDVKRALVNEGYQAENIRVVGPDGSTQASGANASANADTGFIATISSFFQSFTGADAEDEKHYTDAVSSGGALLAVTVPENRADAAAAILESYGAKNVDEQGGGMQSRGATEVANAGAGQKLNVVEEELQVGKRAVQRGGIRVYSHVAERPVEEKVTLREEHVQVERRPVDRAATEADFTAFKEGTIELTETGEEAVVSKRARVVEEIVVGKETSERQETVKDTVRHTEVKVEKIESSKAR